VALFVLSQAVHLWRNKVTTRNDAAGQTKTGKEEKLAAKSTKDAIRKCSQVYFILSTDTKTSRKTKKKLA
jgi:hypothetical protein